MAFVRVFATRKRQSAVRADGQALFLGRARRHRFWRPVRKVLPWTLVWAAAIILFDQGTKFWAEATLERGVPVPVIGEAIQWRLVYNPGAAFGIGAEFTWVYTHRYGSRKGQPVAPARSPSAPG